MDRVYLDNAATSFPKAPGVREAMFRALESPGSPGRGGYAESLAATATLERVRESLARMLGERGHAKQIVLTGSATDALNLAIQGVVRVASRLAGRGVHVVSSVMEHNSVLRPLRMLERQGLARVTLVGSDRAGGVRAADVIDAIGHETVLVVLAHASNVTGVIQPVGAVGEACRSRGVLFLVDAAQSIGHPRVDVRTLHADLVAFPGHKGLLGPSGTGGLYIRPGVEDWIDPWRVGGTGGEGSESESQPTTMPTRFEAGTPNVIGLAGLLASLDWIENRTVDSIAAHEAELVAFGLEFVSRAGVMPGLRLIGPGKDSGSGGRVPVFSFAHESVGPAELASILEREFGVLARSGLLCASRAHASLGTAPRGVLRLSPGVFTSIEEFERALRALDEICRGIA